MNLALDLDGTLITCEPRQSGVLQAALNRYGSKVELQHVWELKRDGVSTEQALLKLGLDPILTRRVAADWQRMIEEPLWLGLDSVLSGVHGTLCDMRSVGAKLWLLTARSRREWVPQQLARLGLDGLFDQVRVVPPLEAAQAKAVVLREMSAVAFFGDSESDWCASTAAEVPFFALASGQRCSAFLSGVGAGPVYHDLAGAWEVLLSAHGRKSDSLSR